MIETLARAVAAVVTIVPRPPVAPSSYIEKVLAGYCFHDHCRKPEASPDLGMCIDHLKELRGW